MNNISEDIKKKIKDIVREKYPAQSNGYIHNRYLDYCCGYSLALSEGHNELPKEEATNSTSPIEPEGLPDQKDEGIRNQIMTIFRDYIHFSPQTESFIVHGATGKIIELFKQWHNELSSPADPASKEQEGDAAEIAALKLQNEQANKHIRLLMQENKY